MTDTRPNEIGRIEAKRIAEEVVLLKKADDEREFREHVLVSLERLTVSMESMSKSFELHVKHDDSRFGSVTQTVNDSKATINKGLGAVGLLAALGAAILWLADRIWP